MNNACPPSKRYGKTGWTSPANRRLCGSLGRIRGRITCETFGKPSWHIRRIERRWNWGRCIAHVAAWSLDWLRLWTSVANAFLVHYLYKLGIQNAKLADSKELPGASDYLLAKCVYAAEASLLHACKPTTDTMHSGACVCAQFR